LREVAGGDDIVGEAWRQSDAAAHPWFVTSDPSRVPHRPVADAEFAMTSVAIRNHSQFTRTLTLASTCAVVALVSSVPALAQQTLPGIVVQGATLEPPPKRAPAPAPVAEDGDDAASSPAPAKPKSAPRRTPRPQAAAPSSAPVAAPSTAPTVDLSAAGPADAAATAAGTAGTGSVGGIETTRTGAAVAVVTGSELKARQIRTGTEALRSLPGVSVNRTGGFAGLGQVRIRGAEGNHTQVLIDGIEANSSTDGEFDFSDLLVEDIERIEVIRGPQSALYGSNALGGVINVITKGGKGPLTIVGRAEYGSFNTRDVAARVSGGTDKAWGAVTVHRQSTGGFNIAPDAILDEDDGSRTTSVSAKAGFRPFDGVEISFNVRNTAKKLDRDDQTGATPGSNRGGFIVATDSLSRFDSNVLLMGGELRWDMLGGALTHVFKATRNVTERNDLSLADFGFGIFPSPFNNTGEDNRFSYAATYRFATPAMFAAKHSVTGLVEKQFESFQPGFTASEFDRERLSYAAEWRGEFFNRLDLSAGVRRDDNDSFPDYTTWRATASLRVPELNIRPHASAGTAIKLPSQFEQFGLAAGFVGNPDLKAEESFGWDAGVEFTIIKNKAVLDVTYFEADLKNKIASVFAGGVFTAINEAGTAQRRGVEVSGRFVVMPGLDLGLAYTWLDAKSGAGLEEERRPRHSGRADVNWAFDGGKGNLNVAAVYNGAFKDGAFTAPFFFPRVAATLDDYWLVTVGASYKLQPGLEIYGRVENALDQKYEEVFGFNTAGVAAYAGLKVTFEDRSNLLAPAVGR
jgi:vitamin B12 transporter